MKDVSEHVDILMWEMRYGKVPLHGVLSEFSIAKQIRSGRVGLSLLHMLVRRNRFVISWGINRWQKL